MTFALGTSSAARPSRRLLSWFLFSRVLVISLFLGGTIVYQLRSGAGTSRTALTWLYLLVSITYLQVVLSAILLPRIRHLRFFAQTQLTWDLLIATFLIYLTGGIASVFSFLYLLIIGSASVLLPRRDVLFVASASAILYGSLLDLQYYGYLPAIGDLIFPRNVNGRDVFFSVFVNVTGFFLTGLLGGTLSERLRHSEQALEKKEIDYEELENLNRTILDNITSGLMIVNSPGRIRSFNEAAERISGFTLAEVYNREAQTIFPSFRLFGPDGMQVVPRGQAEFAHRDGQRRILGYSSSHFRDGRDQVVGLLVIFQDLTHLAEMEERLKRADRLAAVGRLASGMAHEIRNPLASISGSVQLLMDGSNVTDEDRRLMGIVVREAERLSNLLTDFLLYAKPARPRPESFDVAEVFDELLDMVTSDSRFAGVRIERHYQPGTLLYTDRHQLCQALWDLTINAAEVMPQGGILRLGLTGAGELFVEDTGPGIPPEIRDRIFEPFFTTKAGGTGLGLATVHSIVEANGGSIEILDGSGGGTRLVITLPPAVAGRS
jgi:two-component system sensor histidine kinase PilS (NtrC family)